MQLQLHGGFGEKGRTSISAASAGYRLLLDAGVKTSARGEVDYFPLISDTEMATIDAIVISHAHEDHIAALGWCIARGFRGRIFMTDVTLREMDACLAGYSPAEMRALAGVAVVEMLPLGNAGIAFGPLRVSCGRSGHVAGGVWCSVDDGATRFVYCADVVPASPLFVMDRLPHCDAIALDASYGDDDVAGSLRARQIGEWIAQHAGGCVLPTPLFGRSAELLAIIPGMIALAPGMRDALQAQIADSDWLADGAAGMLASRLDAAIDWRAGDALPRAALICHDGMGMAGPSRHILESATMQRHPTLFTGHVPAGSPGERMIAQQRATWIRLPTHPTRSENVVMADATGARLVLGHSCDPAGLARLAIYLPSLQVAAATGDSFDI